MTEAMTKALASAIDAAADPSLAGEAARRAAGRVVVSVREHAASLLSADGERRRCLGVLRRHLEQYRKDGRDAEAAAVARAAAEVESADGW